MILKCTANQRPRDKLIKCTGVGYRAVMKTLRNKYSNA